MVVLCVHDSHNCRVFPWVLEAFEISAYHFYKLIEPAIKHEREFPRSIVKHLNQVGGYATVICITQEVDSPPLPIKKKN